MPDAIDAILLASGFSARFGRDDKLLRPFRGKPLVVHALELACSLPQIDNIFFVHASEQVGKAAEQWLPRIRMIPNARPDRGIAESVRLGVEASAAGYYLFMHCDQPFLDADTVSAVLERRRPGGIAAPSHAGNPGNPGLFSAFFRRELLSLRDGESPRAVKQSHPDRVETVDIHDPLPLRDIDTEEDFRLLAALD